MRVIVPSKSRSGNHYDPFHMRIPLDIFNTKPRNHPKTTKQRLAEIRYTSAQRHWLVALWIWEHVHRCRVLDRFSFTAGVNQRTQSSARQGPTAGSQTELDKKFKLHTCKMFRISSHVIMLFCMFHVCSLAPPWCPNPLPLWLYHGCVGPGGRCHTVGHIHQMRHRCGQGLRGRHQSAEPQKGTVVQIPKVLVGNA